MGGMGTLIQTIKSGCSGTSGWLRDGRAGQLMKKIVPLSSRALSYERAVPKHLVVES